MPPLVGCRVSLLVLSAVGNLILGKVRKAYNTANVDKKWREMARNGRGKDLNYKYLNRRPARQEGPAMSHMTEHTRDTTQARRFVRIFKCSRS
jgi:hypothetical protein